MKTPTFAQLARIILAAGVFLTVLAICVGASPLQKPAIKNIVLVHGAWVDGSGWQPVSELLLQRGYHVRVVQIPETSFADDVAAVQRVLEQVGGPCVLVGHSYGGSVISEAGAHPNVAALVYVAAHAPDAGEDEASLGAKTPGTLAKTPGAIVVTSDGFTTLDPGVFLKLFAPDLPADRAAFMAISQVPAAAKVFHTPLTQAAWKNKPSWGIVAAGDQIINPELEQWYYTRAGSQTTVVPDVGHDIYEARPQVVASVIEQASLTLPEKSKTPSEDPAPASR